VYGRTKLASERALAESRAAHLVLRTSWVFSDHGANFVKTMLRLGAEREHLKVVADQVGAPTSAWTLARITRRVMEQTVLAGRPLGPVGVYNAACSGHTSWHGFAVAIFARAQALGFPLPVRSVEPIPTAAYPTAARRPANSRLDLSKLARTFGVRPEGWEAALDEVLGALRASEPH
jgi:dTDP-4-dehydrorhamnose reductase